VLQHWPRHPAENNPYRVNFCIELDAMKRLVITLLLLACALCAVA
jgi:hypothetical protein